MCCIMLLCVITYSEYLAAKSEVDQLREEQEELRSQRDVS